jgi:hypothetical protein
MFIKKKKKKLEPGSISCLACTRPSVQFPLPQLASKKQINKKIESGVILI